jgi:hypothetical protein
VLVAHTCNPSYPRGRDQEDCILKPAWANSLGDIILKYPSHKKIFIWLFCFLCGLIEENDKESHKGLREEPNGNSEGGNFNNTNDKFG